MSQTPKKINLAAYKKIVRDFLLEKKRPTPGKNYLNTFKLFYLSQNRRRLLIQLSQPIIMRQCAFVYIILNIISH